MAAERYRERGGFFVDARMKHGLEELPLQEVSAPPEVVLFLRQHIGPVGKPLVREGHRVRAGQKVADSDDPLGVPVHSPVSGTVVGLRELPHPMSGRPEPALLIRTEDESTPTPTDEQDPDKLPPEEILTRVREAGVVGKIGRAHV